MKRICVLLGLVLWSSLAFADEAFLLNIPLRFNPQQETGEVRARLLLDSAPGGAQLVVNGTTTLNVGDTTTIAGDEVKFALDAGNSVRITYKPLSNFNTNFCDGGAALEKNVPMRFVGAQDIVRWQISSYVVGAPSTECSQVSKRTGDSPANLIPNDDGVAPALNAVFGSRLPLDVVMVLDKSGSMSELPPGSSTGSDKATILKSAIGAFLTAWKEIDSPTADGAEWSEDRIGDVFFSNTAQSQSLAGAEPPANFFVPRGNASPHPWNAVSSNVDSLTPGGSTSIGAGINEGMSQWKADPKHDMTMILVTDGKQNTAPLITPTPAGVLGLTPVAGLPTELSKRFIPIQTIAFGMPEAVELPLLTNLSFETAGVSYQATSASTMFDTFALTLVSILKGNTVSLAIRRHDTMSGAGPSAAQTVAVDPSAQRVVFMVQWAPPTREALDLEVFRPGSSTVATPDSHDGTPQSVVQTFNPSAADLGNWSVRVTRKHGQEDVPYSLNVFVLEKHLDYRVAFDQIHSGTGESIRVRATVAYDGKPLTKLPADAIRVRIQRPNEGMGTILHDTAFGDPSSGNTTTPTLDVQTPYDRKVASLTSALDRVLPRDVATIPLQEEGKGVYAGAFDQTTVPGVYGFEIVLDWDDPRTGHVHREERLETNVKVKPDPQRSEIVSTLGPDRTVLIRVTPRDKFGNYLGPGHDSLISATTTGAISGPVDRDQTGTYVYTVPADEVSNVTITVDGVNLGNAPPPSTPSSSAGYRVFLDAGVNFPHGKWSINGGLEWLLSSAWSVEGNFGFHRRTAEDLWQLSVNGKRYFGTSAWKPFVNAGIGAYQFDFINTTKAGANAGVGVLCGHFEAAYNYHSIDDEHFSTIQVGVRFSP